MEAAKDAIARYVRVGSMVFNLGFMVYGHKGDNTEVGRAESCREAGELLAPIGQVEPDGFQGVFDRFRPTGWTPIEGTLDEAGEAFAGKEGQENRVIVVSDGIETRGGDPVAAAQRLYEAGIAVHIDVVGFDVPDDETEQLIKIAQVTGGEYYDAENAADLDAYFQQQGEALTKTWEALTCELRNSAHDQLCDQNQCNDATVFRIPEEQQKYEYGSPEYEALQNLSDRITQGFEQRQQARDEAARRLEELQQQYYELR
jgi:hypothetical protein